MKRPDFDSIKTYEEFKKYKWYRNELSNICKAHGLLYNGTEKKLNEVIEAYFNGVRIPPRRDWYTNKLLMGFVNDNGVLMTFDLGFIAVSLILITIGFINKVRGADEVAYVLPVGFGLTGLIVAVLFTYWGQDLDVIRSYIPTCGDKRFTRAQIDEQANSEKTVPLRYGDILLGPDMLIGVSAGVVAVAYGDISSLWVKKTWHTRKNQDYHIYKIIVRTKKGKRIVISKCERDADDAVETIHERCLQYNPQVKILKTRYSLLADEDSPKQITEGKGVWNSVSSAEEQQFIKHLTVDGALKERFISFHRRAALIFIPESIFVAALAVGITYFLATYVGIAFPILIFVLLPFYAVYNLFNTLYWIHKDDIEFYTVEISGKDKKGYSIRGVSYYKFGYIRKLKPDKEPQIGDQVILARFKNEFSLISDKRE
ncbi:hypothetical protein SAMN02910456_01409 [Ruminococcaceae bacterium YRB3002]|nr:hypothetical protein SAMN02910456_01409 [Ruminococcaceae bacterium YRB3002]